MSTSVFLPKEGIYNEEGYLFHHIGTQPLTNEMITRLHEYGTGYQHGKHFKPYEDDIIRQNWEVFKTKHGYEHSSPLELIGIGSRKVKGKQTEDKKRCQKLAEMNFWPKMCKGLPHRCAHQVKQRMAKIFDRFVENIAYNRQQALSFSQLMDFIQAYNECQHIQAAAEKVGLPAAQCRSTYYRYLERQGTLEPKDWRALWHSVSTCAEDYNKREFTKKVRKLLENDEMNRMEEIKIDFDKAAKRLLRNKKYCKKAWKKLIKTLEENYKDAAIASGDIKETWNQAYTKTLGIKQPISPPHFVLFLRILQKCIEDDVEYVPMKKEFCDIEKLKKKLTKAGIPGFSEDETESEAKFLFRKIQRILNRCDELVFSKLAFKYKLKERVEIVCKTFDRQIEKLMSEDDEVSEIQKGAIRKSITGSRGYTILNTGRFIESLVLFSTNLSPDWIPPAVFKKYIRDRKVLELFPEEDDNSALLSRKIIKEYEDRDGHKIFAKRRKLNNSNEDE